MTWMTLEGNFSPEPPENSALNSVLWNWAENWVMQCRTLDPEICELTMGIILIYKVCS